MEERKGYFDQKEETFADPRGGKETPVHHTDWDADDPNPEFKSQSIQDDTLYLIMYHNNASGKEGTKSYLKIKRSGKRAIQSIQMLKAKIRDKIPFLAEVEFRVLSDRGVDIEEEISSANSFSDALCKYIEEFGEVMLVWDQDAQFSKEVDLTPDTNILASIVTTCNVMHAITENVENSIEAIMGTPSKPDWFSKVVLKAEVNDPDKESFIVQDNGVGVDVRNMQQIVKAGNSLNNNRGLLKKTRVPRGTGGGFCYLCGDFSEYGIGTVSTKVIGSMVTFSSQSEMGHPGGVPVKGYLEVDWENIEKTNKWKCRLVQKVMNKRDDQGHFMKIFIKKLTKQFKEEWDTRLVRNEMARLYYLYSREVREIWENHDLPLPYGFPDSALLKGFHPIIFKVQGHVAVPDPERPEHNNEIHNILVHAHAITAPTWTFEIPIQAYSNGVTIDATINCIAYYFPVMGGNETMPHPLRSDDSTVFMPLEQRNPGVFCFWVGKYIPGVQFNDSKVMDFMKKGRTQKLDMDVFHRVVVFAFFPGTFKLDQHKTEFSEGDVLFNELKNPKQKVTKTSMENTRRKYIEKLEQISKTYDQLAQPQHSDVGQLEVRGKRGDGQDDGMVYRVYRGTGMSLSGQEIKEGTQLFLKIKNKPSYAEFCYMYCLFQGGHETRSGARFAYYEWGAEPTDTDQITCDEKCTDVSSIQIEKMPRNPRLTLEFLDEHMDLWNGVPVGEYQVRLCVAIDPDIKLHQSKFFRFAVRETHVKTPEQQQRTKRFKKFYSRSQPKKLKLSLTTPGNYEFVWEYLSPVPRNIVREYKLSLTVLHGEAMSFVAFFQGFKENEKVFASVDGEGVLPDVVCEFKDKMNNPSAPSTDLVKSISLSSSEPDLLFDNKKVKVQEGQLILSGLKLAAKQISSQVEATVEVICEKLSSKVQLHIVLTSGPINNEVGGVKVLPNIATKGPYNFNDVLPEFEVMLYDKAGNLLMGSPLCSKPHVWISGDIEGKSKDIDVYKEKNSTFRAKVNRRNPIKLTGAMGETAAVKISVEQNGETFCQKYNLAISKREMKISFNEYSNVAVKNGISTVTAPLESNFEVKVVFLTPDGTLDDQLDFDNDQVVIKKTGSKTVIPPAYVSHDGSYHEVEVQCKKNEISKPIKYEVLFQRLKLHFFVIAIPGEIERMVIPKGPKADSTFAVGKPQAMCFQLVDSHNNAAGSASLENELTKDDIELSHSHLEVDTTELRVVPVTNEGKHMFQLQGWKLMGTFGERASSKLTVKVKNKDLDLEADAKVDIQPGQATDLHAAIQNQEPLVLCSSADGLPDEAQVYFKKKASNPKLEVSLVDEFANIVSTEDYSAKLTVEPNLVEITAVPTKGKFLFDFSKMNRVHLPEDEIIISIKVIPTRPSGQQKRARTDHHHHQKGQLQKFFKGAFLPTNAVNGISIRFVEQEKDHIYRAPCEMPAIIGLINTEDGNPLLSKNLQKAFFVSIFKDTNKVGRAVCTSRSDSEDEYIFTPTQRTEEFTETGTYHIVPYYEETRTSFEPNKMEGNPLTFEVIAGEIVELQMMKGRKPSESVDNKTHKKLMDGTSFRAVDKFENACTNVQEENIVFFLGLKNKERAPLEMVNDEGDYRSPLPALPSFKIEPPEPVMLADGLVSKLKISVVRETGQGSHDLEMVLQTEQTKAKSGIMSFKFTDNITLQRINGLEKTYEALERQLQRVKQEMAKSDKQLKTVQAKLQSTRGGNLTKGSTNDKADEKHIESIEKGLEDARGQKVEYLEEMRLASQRRQEPLYNLLYRIKAWAGERPGFVGIMCELVDEVKSHSRHKDKIARALANFIGKDRKLALVLDGSSETIGQLKREIRKEFGKERAFSCIQMFDASLGNLREKYGQTIKGAKGFLGHAADLVEPKDERHQKYFTKLFANAIVFDKIEHAEEFKRKKKDFRGACYCLDGRRLQGVWSTEAQALPSLHQCRPIFGQIVTWDSFVISTYDKEIEEIEQNLEELKTNLKKKQEESEHNQTLQDKLELKNSQLEDLLRDVEQVITETQSSQTPTSGDLLDLQTKIKDLLHSTYHV